MSILFLIILSTVLVSLISFIGVFTLSLKDKVLEKILSYLVALSIGAMMAGAFFGFDTRINRKKQRIRTCFSLYFSWFPSLFYS